MSILIYTYLCCNGACRYVEKRSGMRYSQIRCPKCGSIMRLIKTEEE